MVTASASALQAHVLTLNRGYVAVQIITARRAFCLLIKGSAEIVNVEDGHYRSYDFESWRETGEMKTAFGERNDDEDWINSVSFCVEVPRVIRLLRYARVPQHVVKFNRHNIFLRDHNCCQYCKRRFPSSQLSLDHVVPRSRGGQTTWDNIVSACLKCNVAKGGRTPREAGMTLANPPRKPNRSLLLPQAVASKKYTCWQSFLTPSQWTNQVDNPGRQTAQTGNRVS